MKIVAKVIVVFVVWVALGLLFGALSPVAQSKYVMGTFASDPDDTALAQQYSNVVATLVGLGLRNEGEVLVPGRRQTRFTGMYGNISDIQIDVACGKSPSRPSLELRCSAKYVYPRWRDGRSGDHKVLKSKIEEAMGRRNQTSRSSAASPAASSAQ